MDIWKAQLASSKEAAQKMAQAERKKWEKAQQSFAAFT
jgi:hypothetical protein